MLFNMLFKKSEIVPMEDLQKTLEQYNFEACTGGIKTIPVSNIESYLKKYQEFSKVKTDNALFNTKLSELKNAIEYQYFRNFGSYGNLFNRAKSFEELSIVIKEVEAEFDKKIHEAQAYFGTYINGEFHFGILITEAFQPHSIEEILNRDSSEWFEYYIDSGCPQPIYKDRYNEILKKAIENFVTGT